MGKKIEVAIVGDASKFKRELDDAERSTSKFSTGLGKMKIAAVAAGVGGIAVATKFLKGSISAAMDAQRVQAQTESQLKALGISYKAHAAQINEVINKTSMLAAIDDEELQGAFNDLVRVTGNVNTALKDTALAADVARGKHIELDAATKIVTKAQLGMVGSLKRMGIDIPAVTTAVDALKASKEKYSVAEMNAAKAADLTATKQAAIAALQTKFAGAAEAYGKTAQGAMDRFHVAVENLQESIGNHLLPALTVLLNKGTEIANYLNANLGPSVHKVINALSQFKGEAQFVANVLGNVLKAAVVVIRVNFQLYELQIKAASAALNACKTAAQSVASFFSGVFSGAVNAAKAVVSALDRALDGVKSALSAVRGAGVGVASFFQGAGKSAFNAFKGVVAGIVGVVNSLVAALQAVAGAARAAADAIRSIPHPPNPLNNKGIPSYTFGGKRAAGGPVGLGKSYLVGEEGPEIFTPSMSGQIIPLTGRTTMALRSAGAALGTSFKGGLQRIITPDVIRGPIAAAKAAADSFIENTGVDNMMGAGQMLGTALREGLGHGLESSTPLGIGAKIGPALNAIGPGALAGGGNTTVIFPNYVGDKQDIAGLVQRELLRINRRNTTLGFT